MTEIVFIGTSDALGAGGRRQSAVLLRAPNGGVLLDCGMSTNAGLADLQIDRAEIDTVLISHFHADHFGGLPLLLLASMYEDRRVKPLRIAGPPGVEERVQTLARAMGHPIGDRDGRPPRDWTFPIHFEEYLPGAEIEIGPARVRSFDVHHQPDSKPHGLALTLGSQRIAYTGDTGWFEGLTGAVAGSDLLICECTFATDTFEYHLNYEELLTRREQFDCGRMILTHLGAQMTARRGKCEIETADDGLRVSV